MFNAMNGATFQRTPSRARVRVLLPNQLLGPVRSVGGVFFGITLQVLLPRACPGIFSETVSGVVPLVAAIVLTFRLRSVVWALFIGAIWGISVELLLKFLFTWTASPLMKWFHESIYSTEYLIFDLTYEGILHSVLFVVGWLGIRWLRGPVIIQDGTLCDMCAYSLIGNVSGTCPECGSQIPSLDRQEYQNDF